MRIAHRIQCAILRREPRLAEAMAACMTLGVGALLAGPGDSFTVSPAYWLAGEFLPEHAWAAAFLLVGGIKLAGAIGGWYWPRMVAAVSAMSLWGGWIALVGLGSGGAAVGLVLALGLFVTNGALALLLVWTRDGRHGRHER